MTQTRNTIFALASGALPAAVIIAAAAYSLLVFAIGFMVGTIRVLFLVPRIGDTLAVFVELPIMVSASFIIANWVVKRWRVPFRLTSRAVMGAGAFAILMCCEVFTSLFIFGNSWDEHMAHYYSFHAWLGLFGQIVFAVMPVLLLVISRWHSVKN